MKRGRSEPREKGTGTRAVLAVAKGRAGEPSAPPETHEPRLEEPGRHSFPLHTSLSLSLSPFPSPEGRPELERRSEKRKTLSL